MFTREDVAPVREKITKTLRRFLLSLSDQQLITGIAICMAAYVSICNTQIYHFVTACHMALLAFLVHTLTLVTLRRQFHDNLPYWGLRLRIALIYCNVLLLSPSFLFIPVVQAFEFEVPLEARPAFCLLNGSLVGRGSVNGWIAFGFCGLGLALCCVFLPWYIFFKIAAERRRLKRFLTWMTAFLVLLSIFATLTFIIERAFGSRQGHLAFEGDDDTWSFGQILPVALLLLTPLYLLEMK